ncbi:MAG: DNA polymerase III subunit beta [Alphaproteobacteria bacterium]|nr:DNA polymerase III subunit beta [Alphaproteobacteria bacterium]
MRAKVSKNDILPALMRTVSIADKKSIVPILSNVLLDFNESGLCIKATDLDQSIIEKVPAEVDTFGMAAVPASTLNDIVKKAAGDAVLEFSLLDKGNKLQIISGRSKFELSTLDPSGFPEVETLKNGFSIKLKSKDLAKLISRTKFSMSPEESRRNLNGIYVHKEDSKLKAASTDGHRLSTTQIDIDIKETIQGVIISKKTVFEIKKLLDIFEDEISITLTENQIQFVFGDIIFIAKLVEGVFPEYKRVIPDSNNDFFRVKRTSFCETLDRIAIMSEDKVRSVKLELSKDTLVCYAVNSRVGTGKDEIDVAYSGEGWSSGFNANYLLDVAQTLEGEYLKIFVKESLSPILIIDEDEPESMFVVMPMRI